MLNTEPVFIDLASGNYKRGIFNAIIAPRPIGWMSTVDAHGNPNLAPFSYFNIMSNDPPVIVFSCNTPEDRLAKDTLKNVWETGEFVYNLACYDLVKEMNMTSTPTPAGVDEFEYAGIEKAPCKFIRAPRVARSPVSLECTVLETLKLASNPEDPGVHVIFGKVIGMHIRAGFLDDEGHFKTDLAKPVARLGGAEYAVTQAPFELKRQFTRANESTY